MSETVVCVCGAGCVGGPSGGGNVRGGGICGVCVCVIECGVCGIVCVGGATGGGSVRGVRYVRRGCGGSEGGEDDGGVILLQHCHR